MVAQRIKETYGFEPPVASGYDVVASIKAMHEGKAKVFMCLGGNFTMAASDTKFTAEAIENCNLTVQISTKLNRSHLITEKNCFDIAYTGQVGKDLLNGDDRFVTVESSTGRVRRSKGIFLPPSPELKSEPWIIGRMARAYFNGVHSIQWEELADDYQALRKGMAKIFSDYKAVEEKSKKGYHLPNGARIRFQ